MREMFYPQGWQKCLLGIICDIQIGGTPSRNEPRFWATSGDGHMWVAISDLGPKWIKTTEEHITDFGVKYSNVKRVPKGTLLMSFKLTIGRIGFAGHELYTNEAIAAFYPKEKYIWIPWLYHALPSIIENNIAAEQAVKGQTLNKAKLQNFILHRPRYEEQRRIAEILDTIDTQIQRTEQLITKLKLQRRGLLQDLLTYGLNEHGQLRDPIAHPEQFKDSMMGRIPQDWEIRQLKTLVSCPITDFGSFSMTNLLDFRTSGVPFLRTEAIQDDGIDKSQITFISEKIHKQLPQSVVHAGDVLFTKIGASLGRVCVYDGSLGECNSNAASAKLRLEISKANPHFVAHYLRSSIAKRQYMKEIISIPPRINLGQINNWYIPVPTLSEQNDIVATLDAIETNIRTEEVYCDKLKLSKKGLVQDLLTGRVRVNVEESVLSGIGPLYKETKE